MKNWREVAVSDTDTMYHLEINDELIASFLSKGNDEKYYVTSRFCKINCKTIDYNECKTIDAIKVKVEELVKEYLENQINYYNSIKAEL